MGRGLFEGELQVFFSTVHEYLIFALPLQVKSPYVK